MVEDIWENLERIEVPFTLKLCSKCQDITAFIILKEEPIERQITGASYYEFHGVCEYCGNKQTILMGKEREYENL